MEGAVSMAKKADPVVFGVLGCTALFVLGLAGTVAGGVLWLKSRGDSGAAPSGSTTLSTEAPSTTSGVPSSPSGSPSSTAAFSDEPRQTPYSLEWDQPVNARSMDAIDVTDLLPQARRMAERLQPGAALVGILAFKTTRGKVDLTGDDRVVFMFEYAGDDPALPAGKQAVERSVDVQAQRGRLHAERHTGLASLLKDRGPLETPTCTTTQAWEAATKSGVADDVTAEIRYFDSTPEPGGPWVWNIEVSGHEDFRRQIDGKTCALVRTWGAPPSGTDTPSPADAPSASASVAPSGTPLSPVAAATTTTLPSPAVSPVKPPVVKPPVSPPVAPTSPASNQCTLSMNSIPTSQVSLDGRALGPTPRINMPVACGSHTVTFVHPNYGRKSIPISLSPGRPGLAAIKF